MKMTGPMGFMMHLAQASAERSAHVAHMAAGVARDLADMGRERQMMARRAAKMRLEAGMTRRRELDAEMDRHRRDRAETSRQRSEAHARDHAMRAEARREAAEAGRDERHAFMSEFKQAMWGGFGGAEMAPAEPAREPAMPANKRGRSSSRARR